MAGMTIRLPDPLKARAAEYAGSLGISFTALVAVALKDYLDARDGQPPVQSDPLPAQRPAVKSVLAPKLKVGRNEPCPCGSGKKFKVCCGP